ncbi:MAG: CopG family transcriptional regulator [Caldilineae bacterium]|nr:CopG family transcriptional regulator [Chloroflexota bacterium]MCB9175892.1 CopG family transcriptional regulator [Caldilineae bacterium]
MIRAQIQFEKEQMEALRRMSAEEGLSVAALVRRSVDVLISSRSRTPDDELRRRALAAAGRFASGRGDLADEHDRYLEEAFGA